MLRIGCVPFLNAKPLIEGLEGVRLIPPSRLAERVVSGTLDVALVPVAHILRHGLAYLPGIAIASSGEVDSVRLYHTVPVTRLRRVALDRNSGTSNLLARILLERRYGVRPEYVARNPARGLSFKGYDGAVAIGDNAWRPRGVPYLDLGREWKAFTGRPMVYALWAHRKGHPRAREMARILRAAKELGLSRIGQIARRESLRLGLSPAFCRKYLTRHISFDLGAAERAGLRLYARYARALTSP